jgi:hypothetical protein
MPLAIMAVGSSLSKLIVIHINPHSDTHIMMTKKVLHGSSLVGQEMKTTPQPTYYVYSILV